MVGQRLNRWGKLMDRMRLLPYITASVDLEHLFRGEYLATENRILKAQFKSAFFVKHRQKQPR